MKKTFALFLLVSFLGLKAQYGTINAILDRLEERKGINQNLNFPNPERLKEILIRDYGREKDFNITINNVNIGVLDLQGKSFSERIHHLYFQLKTSQKSLNMRLDYAFCISFP